MQRLTVVVAGVVAGVVAVVVLGACGGANKSASSGTATTTSGTTSGTGTEVVTVQPLQEIVTKVVDAYEAGHSGVKVAVKVVTDAELTKSASGRGPLVVVSSTAALEAVKGLHPGSLGRDLAVIAVPAANPKHITTAQAFASKSGLRTEVCGATTSIGNFSLLVLAKAGVTPAPATVHAGCEQDALQKVAKGSLDAALMFRGGLTVPTGVKLVAIAAPQNIVVPVSYATVGTSAGTDAFAAFLASGTAQNVLTENGYLP